MKKPNEKYQKQKEQSGIVSVESLSLADIGFDARNANKGSVRGRGQIEASLREFGFADAGTLDRNNVIIGGNKRTEVAGEIGMDEAIIIDVDGTKPVFIRRPDLDLNNPDDDRARRLAYALNRSQEASLTWDAEVLFADMQNGLDLSAFWNQDELDALLEGMNDDESANAGADTEPQVDKAEAEKINERYQVKKGDVWTLGQHTIACIDSCEREQVLKIIGDAKVDFVWADPPYGIKAVSDGKVFNNKTLAAKSLVDNPNYAAIIGDETIKTAVESSGLYLSLYPKAAHVWWGGNYYASALPNSSCWIIWDKETGEGFFADAELAWTNQDTAVRIFKHQWKGLIKESERGEKRLHPTQKPIALAEWTFAKYGKANDVIVDPFLGSGISVLAAEELNDGRSVFGFELAPEYIAVTIHRWEAATGASAVLLGR